MFFGHFCVHKLYPSKNYQYSSFDFFQTHQPVDKDLGLGDLFGNPN